MKKSLLTVMTACGICTGVFGAGRDLSVNSEKTGERPAVWKPVTWANVPGAATLKIIETPDHIDGGKAVYWKVNETSPEKAPEYLGVMARPVVPVPGKKYKVTFWAKSSENSVVSVTLWGFSKGMKKEFRVPNVFKITPEWKQFEFSYSVPSAAEDPVFAANPWYQFAFDLFRDKNKDFTFKDVKIEEEKQ